MPRPQLYDTMSRAIWYGLRLFLLGAVLVFSVLPSSGSYDAKGKFGEPSTATRRALLIGAARSEGEAVEAVSILPHGAGVDPVAVVAVLRLDFRRSLRLTGTAVFLTATSAVLSRLTLCLLTSRGPPSV